MKNKWVIPTMVGGCGCLTGVIATIVIAFIAIVIFAVVWGNNQDWYPDPTDSSVVATDSAVAADSADVTKD